MKILVLNGPNLNMLGKREPNIYGNCTLKDIENLCKHTKQDIKFRQTNHEGEMVSIIQDFDGYGIVINPGAYTHTSIAIRDAILSIGIPTVEIHISNIQKREDFRHKSYISDIATGTISGLGIMGYKFAIEFLMKNH